MIQIHKISTGMGKLIGKKLPFLTQKEQNEFDNIGYTGKDSNGKKTTFNEYLNSLNKGEFDVDKTKYDSGDFYEEYTITRVT